MKGSNHWIYVDCNKSISNSKVYYMDYAGSQLAFSGEYANYKIQKAFIYPVTTSTTNKKFTPANITEGDYILKNGSKYLSAPNDKEGGALNKSDFTTSSTVSADAN